MGSDTDRRELHAALQEHLGERPATILMDLLPPVGYADLVTGTEFRAEMGAVRAEMRTEFAAVRTEVAGLRTELKGDIAEVRGDIAEIRGEIVGIHGEIAGIRAEIQAQTGRFLAAAFPLMFGFAGLVLAAVKLA